MRPLQCPSCGHSLGAITPGPGGRRTCPSCHFSFVPVHSAEAGPEGILERLPLVFGVLVLLPLVIGGLLHWWAPALLRDLLRPAFGPGQRRETVLATGTGENMESGRSEKASTKKHPKTTAPPFVPVTPPARRYPAVVQKVVPLAPGVLPDNFPLPGTIAPPPPVTPPATLELQSEPAGADVVNDATGVGLGITPLVLSLQPGSYRLRFSMPGRRTKIAEVKLGPGDVSRLSISLNDDVLPGPGLLLLDSEPIQADVYRDGVLIGATPLQLELPGGQDFQLLLRKPGYEDLIVTARVPSGGRQRIRAILPGLTSFLMPDGTPMSEDMMRQMTMADGTAPPLGPYKTALPVLGSASSQNVLTGGISPDREGNLAGYVRFEGTLPALEFVPVTVDQGACGTTPRASERLVVTENRGMQNVVVWLAGGELDKQLAPAVVNSSLQIVDCRFLPHVQAIPLGTTVQFGNLQTVGFHLLFTDQQNLSTQLTLEASQSGRPLVFKVPGIYHVTEATGHRWMEAFIHVMPSPYYAISDAGGQFTLRGVPKGSYVLRAWHEWLGPRTLPVSVEAGRTTTVGVTYQAQAR